MGRYCAVAGGPNAHHANAATAGQHWPTPHKLHACTGPSRPACFKPSQAACLHRACKACTGLARLAQGGQLLTERLFMLAAARSSLPWAGAISTCCSWLPPVRDPVRQPVAIGCPPQLLGCLALLIPGGCKIGLGIEKGVECSEHACGCALQGTVCRWSLPPPPPPKPRPPACPVCCLAIHMSWGLQGTHCIPLQCTCSSSRPQTTPVSV